MSRGRIEILRRREPLRLGFLPVNDCAPLVYAYEAGLFGKYGLEVQLQRETSWAQVRDKVVYGELDGAHAPATLPFVANLSLEADASSCVTGLVLSLQGNAITVSRRLWDEGVRDAATLREQVYRHWRKRTYTFGVAFALSTHDLLLRQWLAAAGLVPGVEIRIVAIPPAQMFPTLKLGYIDGYCVGEPWTSLAVQAGLGVRLATSADLAPRHPEKVLMVRQSFATGRAQEHERLLAALLEACAFCDQPSNRPLLSDLLANSQYVNAPAECVSASLVGPFDAGEPGIGNRPAASIFFAHNANEPTDDKARWVMESLYELLRQGVYQPDDDPARAPVLKNVFRRDVYWRARETMQKQNRKIEAVAQSMTCSLAPTG